MLEQLEPHKMSAKLHFRNQVGIGGVIITCNHTEHYKYYSRRLRDTCKHSGRSARLAVTPLPGRMQEAREFRGASGTLVHGMGRLSHGLKPKPLRNDPPWPVSGGEGHRCLLAPSQVQFKASKSWLRSFACLPCKYTLRQQIATATENPKPAWEALYTAESPDRKNINRSAQIVV